MSVSAAFTQLGNTVVFTAAATAPTPVQCEGNSLGPTQYRIINAGTNTVFMGYGANASTATANAVIPTGGGANSTFSIPLLPGTDEILTFMPNAYFTGVTSANTSVIYITCGDGM